MAESPVQIVGSVYDQPAWYDALFSDTVPMEVAFLTRLSRRYGAATRPSFFEPACGTGRILWRLAKQGINVVGLDLNPKSIDFCNRRLKRHGLPETAFIGDMTAFTLNDLRQRKPFDLAFNMVSSFLHLTTEDAARDHLKAVAAALKPGGIYVLGLHLLPLVGKAFCAEEQWTAKRGTLALNSHLKRLKLDKSNRLETVEFRIRARSPRKNVELTDRFSLRTYTADQFRELLKSVGSFEVLETFDFCLNEPIRIDPKTEDAVFILQSR